MPTIVALNPAKNKKKKKRKKRAMTALQKKYFGPGRKGKKKVKGTTMAKKKKRGGYKKQRTYRRNPNGGRGSLLGVNMFGAVKSTVPLLFGALAAKFTAKKFASGGAESDNWTWKNHLLALTGGLVASFATGAILKKRGAAQKVFEGALLLVAYKVFTGEIAPTNQSLESWFGADEDIDPYAGLGDGLGDFGELGDGIGDVWQAGSSNYVRGVDGMWRPSDESHRRPRGGIPFGYRRGMRKGMGDVLVTPDSRYGDILVDRDARYSDAYSARTMAKAIEADGM